MNVEIDITWIVIVTLLAARLSTVFWMTPFDGMGRLPVRIRIILLLSISALLASTVGVNSSLPSFTIWTYLVALMAELVLGAVLAFGLYAGFASIHLGGKLLDFQSGFGAAAIFNPGTGQQDPIWGSILTVFAVLIFFSTDTHLVFLKGLGYITQNVPPGFSEMSVNFNAILNQFGKIFVWGLALVAPAVVALLVIDAAIGMVARTMPQMNVYFVMLPLKIYVAILVMSLSLSYLVPFIGDMFSSIARYWERGSV